MPNKLLEQFKKLPEDIKDLLFDERIASVIGEIGKRYNLDESRIMNLSDETGLVLFGVLHPKDFIPDLAQKLGVEKEVARKIAEEVNQQIFQKVRESLRKLHGLDEEVGIKNKELGIREEQVRIMENVPKPPAPPAAPPHPSPKATEGAAKIVIKENITVPKEVPKEELKPLEIRPIKGGPFTEPEARNIKLETQSLKPENVPSSKIQVPSATPSPTQEPNVFGSQPQPKKLSELIKESSSADKPERISPRPQLDFPPRRSSEEEHSSGLRVMPRSPEELGIRKNELGDKEKPTSPLPPQNLPFMPTKPGGDPYRERLE